MRQGLLVTAAAFLLGLGVSDAAAQQWVQTTASDSVVIDGAKYPRFTFAVHNWHPNWGFDQIGARRWAPTIPEDTCRVIRAFAPPGWQLMFFSAEGFVWSGDYTTFVLPGDSISGFQIVLTPGHSTCFTFGFGNQFDSVGLEEDCFGGPDVPVAAKASTWGALKARYR